MYEEYFGLSRPPFKISPDTSLFFAGGKRGDILGALVYAVQRGEGIVKVVGEVGSGKTMLCRMLQLKLPKSVEIIYIGNPSVSAEDILFVIAHELELHASKDASKHEVMHMLHDYLLQRHIENRQVVLFIEEAQGMPLETLEEIRLLSNLETDEHKLMQIILFGQPELDDNLSNKSIRQLRERITHNFNLSPLTHMEIHSYLNFRMREVGYTGPELITESLAKKIQKYSKGLLRRVNIIADKILLSAFSESTHNLTNRHVVAAVNDSDFSGETRGNASAIWWLLVPALIAVIFAIYNSQPLWSEALVQIKAEIPGILKSASLAEDEPTEDPGDLVDASSQPIEVTPQQSDVSTEQGAENTPTEEFIEPESTAIEAVTIEPEEVPEAQLIDARVASSDPELVDADAVVAEIEVETQDEAVEISSPAAAEESIVTMKVEPAEIDPAVDEPKIVDTIVAAEEDTSGAQQDGSVLAVAEATQVSPTSVTDHSEWLSMKLQQSREWLSHVDKGKVSIQVLMRRKSAAHELVYYLRNNWPLDLNETYLYEVSLESQVIYRVFYSEFDSVAHGQREIEVLPDSLKSNSPYLHSVYRMQKVFL
jgi:type II secretory pathway predicted ATPase ExeA